MTMFRGRWLRHTSLVAVAVAVACAMLALRDAHAQGPVVIADGHIDIGPAIVDGAWRLQLRDDTGTEPAWRDLNDVVLHAVDAARTTVPEGEAYRFLGAAGTDTWLLPQAQRPGILWPGWNTQHPSIAGEVQRNVTWTMHSVEGPGDFVLFLTGSFGDSSVLFSTREPFPQSFAIEMGTHVHGNWAFSAPGVYRMTMSMSGTTAAGATLSDTAVLTVIVGDGEPTPPPTPASTATAPPIAGTATPVSGGSTAGPGTGTPPAGGDTPTPSTSTPADETPAQNTATTTPRSERNTPATGTAAPGADAPANSDGGTTPDRDGDGSSTTLLILAVASAAMLALLPALVVVWRRRQARSTNS